MSSVLSLDEAKSHLNMTSSVDDAELSATVDAAESAIIARIGPLVSDDVTTARVQGRRAALLLPTAPVVSLTSLTEVGGSAVDTSGLYLDTAAGTIVNSDDSWFTAASYDVVYTAGYDEVPADILFAVKELTRHLWRSQRGAASLPGQGGGDTATPGYLLPNAVAELIEPYRVPAVG